LHVKTLRETALVSKKGAFAAFCNTCCEACHPGKSEGTNVVQLTRLNGVEPTSAPECVKASANEWAISVKKSIS